MLMLSLRYKFETIVIMLCARIVVVVEVKIYHSTSFHCAERFTSIMACLQLFPRAVNMSKCRKQNVKWKDGHHLNPLIETTADVSRGRNKQMVTSCYLSNRNPTTKRL